MLREQLFFKELMINAKMELHFLLSLSTSFPNFSNWNENLSPSEVRLILKIITSLRFNPRFKTHFLS